MELPLAREAILRYGLETPGTATTPTAPIALARRIAARVNAAHPPGTPSIQAGELAALALLHEIFHLVVDAAAEQDARLEMDAASGTVRSTIGTRPYDTLLRAVAAEFPELDARDLPERLEELLLLRVTNENPALGPLRELVDDGRVAPDARDRAIATLEALAADGPVLGDEGLTLVELLRAPARAHPTSLSGQLRWIRERWGTLLGDRLTGLLGQLLMTVDVISEEERGLHQRFGGGFGDAGGRPDISDFSALGDEPERFSSDDAWMPRLVLIAKTRYVWLDQLSHAVRPRHPDARRHPGRGARPAGAVRRHRPVAHRPVGAKPCLAADQAAGAATPTRPRRAYSLDDYGIADDLGGEDA